MIWEALKGGMLAGAWVMGLMLVLIAAGLLLYIACAAMAWAWGGEEGEKNGKPEDTGAGVHAPGVGRDHRPGVGSHD